MRMRKTRLSPAPLSREQVKKISRFALLGIFLLLAFCILRIVLPENGRGSPHRTDIEIAWDNPEVKNSADLVKYAQNALNCQWGYVYGTYGQILDPALLESCKQKYDGEITPYLDLTSRNWMGGRVADCAGLIKGYGWLDPKSDEIRYRTNGMPDLNANGMAQAAAEKGEISSMPEIPGLAVWMDGHIGVYIGNGEVIEAMSAERGVVKTKLKGRGWLMWLKVPSIRYGQQVK
jgi:hypothetical protein